MTDAAPPIDRVVVLMLENHCFDRMLGCMQERYPALEGIDPAKPRTNPDPLAGTRVAQRPTTTRNIVRDPNHELDRSLRQLDGGVMEGFIADFVRTYPRSTPEERAEIMAWYPRGFLPALHTLAEDFVICDHWFSSLPGPTWINRLFAHSGTSLGHVQEPENLFQPNLHLYDQPTLYDELSSAGVPWRIYYGDVPQTLVLTRQWNHLDCYRNLACWQQDVAAGDLPAYTFIEPAYFPPHQNDQHPPHDIMRGDRLIAEIYNPLRANSALFARTLLVVLYDEHGGFYDHVVPPATIPPDEHTQHYSFDRLGMRVPAILVSPWLDPGLVTTEFDHTSLLRMASHLWPNVPPLGRRAAQANVPTEVVHWRDAPRVDLPEARVAPDIQPPRPLARLSGFAASLYSFSEAMEHRMAGGWIRRALVNPMRRMVQGGHQQGRVASRRIERFIAQGGV